MEYNCPECGFVTPTKSEVSDPSIELEKDHTYTEYTCPSCDTVLLTTRERRPTKTESHPKGAWPRCACGHPTEYHDNDGFCCGNFEDFKAIGERGQSSCQCKEYTPRRSIMIEIDWTKFDDLSEMNCTCRCGTNFRSHFKVTYKAGNRQSTTRKSCPNCGRNDGTYAVSSDPEEFTIRR